MKIVYSILGTAVLGFAMITAANTVSAAKSVDRDYRFMNNSSYVESYDYEDRSGYEENDEYDYNRYCDEDGRGCRRDGRGHCGRRNSTRNYRGGRHC